MKMIIPTADDSSNNLITDMQVSIFLDTWTREDTNTVHIALANSGVDRVHLGICEFWQAKLKRTFNHGAISLEIVISDYCIVITKDRNYKMNGQFYSKENICHILSRLSYASINDKDRTSIRDKYAMYCKTPNDVIYALENRTPYHWYDAGRKIDVRLNTKRISDTEMALEISDGVWGAITTKKLSAFLSFYLHNRKQTKWKFMSPSKLYCELMGREPSESDLELMIAFLSQNRTSKIVEERAKELLVSMVKQYPDRIYMEKFGGTGKELIHIRVKGKEYEWLLQEKTGFTETSTQKVSVYVLGSDYVESHSSHPEEDSFINGVTVTNYIESFWKGPICIDNMSRGSSLGDQFASRIFAVMNDNMTIARVSTLKSYLQNAYAPKTLGLTEGIMADFRDKRKHSTVHTITTTTTTLEEEFQ